VTTNPTFTVTEEQQMLRSSARQVLEARGGSERVREVMMTDEAVDEAAYKELAQMGLVGLLVPEEHGGSGSTFVEAGIVLEELGRALLPVPYLSSAVLATTAILAGGSGEQQAAHLPDLASGERRATLAHLDEAGRLDADPGVQAEAKGDTFELSGTSGYVLDGLTADLLVVAATTGEGIELFVVPADAAGVSREKVDVLDLTRPMATVRFEGVAVDAGDRLSGAGGAEALHEALTAGLVAIASEQSGASRYVHEDVTEFARTRMQFGRAIGSFQAIKHRIADLMVELESSTSAVMHAQRSLAAGDRQEVAIAAPMAKAYASEVFEHIAGEAIQIYGGIGFTWEHDAHLYFKRAKASRLLLGSPHQHRRVLADVLGL
jgi:alkylation response protein AidB-like acyl-CoA dehydrogenase